MMLFTTRLPLVLYVLALPSLALADGHAAPCPMSYDDFEVGVPHTDLETCPASMAVEGAFCRVSLVAEVATVFVFSDETNCIMATKSYFDEQFTLTLN